MNEFTFDGKELLVRIFKYIFEGLIVAVAAYLIPGKTLKVEQILTIGIIAAATFSVLDLFAPSIGSSVRNGAGLGIGLSLTNAIPGSGPVFR
jgi:ABC-type Co2+ transport system permease subunit